MFNRKPYRTKAQKAEARRTARKAKDGAWRSNAPFCLHGQPGEWVWDASHKVPVRQREREDE
jgi:endonuclease YncB( thermonuclease family)